MDAPTIEISAIGQQSEFHTDSSIVEDTLLTRSSTSFAADRRGDGATSIGFSESEAGDQYLGKQPITEESFNEEYHRLAGKYPRDVSVNPNGIIATHLEVGKMYNCPGLTVISHDATLQVNSHFNSNSLIVLRGGTVTVGGDITLNAGILVEAGGKVVAGSVKCHHMIIDKDGHIGVRFDLNVSSLAGSGSLYVGRTYTGGDKDFLGEIDLRGNRDVQ